LTVLASGLIAGVAAIAGGGGTDAQPPVIDVTASPVAPDAETAWLAAEAAEIDTVRSVRDDLRQFPAAWPIVRGIYATRYSFYGSKWAELIDIVRTTEVNSIVIDVKDDSGLLNWQMLNVALAHDSGADAEGISADEARAKVRELREAGGYPIARVVCFKDSRVAELRPDLAIIDSRTGEPWRDRTGAAWLNPWNPETWEYLTELGREARRMGFLEVQWDYVRFPSDGELEYATYPFKPDEYEDPVDPEAIRRFLEYGRTELHEVGVRVSADVFAYITTVPQTDDQGIGQVYEVMAAELDYISPMTYPSHYSAGNYGQDNPQAAPYEIVWNAMREAQTRAMGLDVIVRPWIEDFAYRGPHDPSRVTAQMRGVYENGIEGWLLWNAGNEYSLPALEEYETARAEPCVPPTPTDEPTEPASSETAVDQGPTAPASDAEPSETSSG